MDLQQEIPPLIIGERANSNGSKKFRELLLADDFQACLRIAADQESRGAQVIDLCTAYAGRDESTDMTTMVAISRNIILRKQFSPTLFIFSAKNFSQAIRRTRYLIEMSTYRKTQVLEIKKLTKDVIDKEQILNKIGRAHV